MRRIGIQCNRVAWIALACAFLSGCVAAPMRVPTKTRNVSGEVGKKLDLTFIQVGTTTREEVGQKLGWIDAGVKGNRIFVGRWADSSWGVVWAVAGYTNAVGGWNRGWTTHTVVLDFDEKGVVRQMSVVPDKDILSTLSKPVSEDSSGSLDLSTPIKLPVEHIRSSKHFMGTLELGRDAFVFLQDRETSPKEVYDFRILPAGIGYLTMGHGVPLEGWVSSECRTCTGTIPPSVSPGNVVVTIHFKRSTSVGSKMNVRVDLPTVITLIRYIAQTRAGP
jgi:hypothetical protein